MGYAIALSRFSLLRPPYETAQKETLDWLVEAHAAAESHSLSTVREVSQFRETIREKLWHVGCKPEGIQKRGHVLPDYLHCNWEMMQVYRLDESPQGSALGVRTHLFEAHVDQAFAQFYVSPDSPPNHLIHVSCTGYVSPSAAQKIVSFHGWGERTQVTHAYHMGCYGAIPALRIASGFLSAEGGQADIVHTEICSLHVNPALHTTDQLVTQSLFADGFIKYSASQSCEEPHLSVWATHEEIISGSIGSMTWKVGEFNFAMSLSKEVPLLIGKALDDYLIRLCRKANRFPEKIMTEAIFAVHPGGPKILNFAKKHLQLKDHQMEHSVAVLRECGNMSSATLPHIWQAILEDDRIRPGTPIITLAFGPGLTISGAVMEKCGP